MSSVVGLTLKNGPSCFVAYVAPVGFPADAVFASVARGDSLLEVKASDAFFINSGAFFAASVAFMPPLMIAVGLAKLNAVSIIGRSSPDVTPVLFISSFRCSDPRNGFSLPAPTTFRPMLKRSTPALNGLFASTPRLSKSVRARGFFRLDNSSLPCSFAALARYSAIRPALVSRSGGTVRFSSGDAIPPPSNFWGFLTAPPRALCMTNRF